MKQIISAACICITSLLIAGCRGTAQQTASVGNITTDKGQLLGNKPEREEWFINLGLGLFIHWSMDSQLGMVISHSMVGASDDYLDRFINQLPGSFNPKNFNPEDWAGLARLCGFKYVVFTTKHHSGFCMWDTKTTNFNIMNTPYRRDIVRRFVDAFRAEGLAVGFYFSPDDFWFVHRQGFLVNRRIPEVLPSNNPELMAHNKAQLRELLTNYGPIDVLFLDGEPNGLRELAWQLQPEILVTRGWMETPEQKTPDGPMPGPWEACMTMGTQWQYKATNEHYKSGTQLINYLIEIRAKGGNYLLNIGPHPDGTIVFEQERLMREVGLWLFINGEAIYNIRPWHVIREGDIWLTKAKDSNTVYAFVTKEVWPYGQWRTVTLKSVRATESTEIEILGQNGKSLEYQPQVIPKTTWTQQEDGLHVRAMRAQRIYNDRTWPNPVVLKITNAEAVK